MKQSPANYCNYLVSSPIAMNTSFNLSWVPIYYKGYYVQAVWTGTPTGYFVLNASGDAYQNGGTIIPAQNLPFYVPPSMITPVNSSPILGSQYNITGAGSNAWNVYNAEYSWVQLSYVDSSGGTSTATLNFANITQKGG
jgi:hypothetical protein